MCKGYLEHFGSNLRIFTLEYRLSSAKPFKQANPFPASLMDAVAGYRYLVHDLGFDLIVTPLTGLLAAARQMRMAYEVLRAKGIN